MEISDGLSLLLSKAVVKRYCERYCERWPRQISRMFWVSPRRNALLTRCRVRVKKDKEFSLLPRCLLSDGQRF